MKVLRALPMIRNHFIRQRIVVLDGPQVLAEKTPQHRRSVVFEALQQSPQHHTTKARPPKKMCVALAFLYAALTKKRDPNEEPIILLGSVFDVNSLGKWIYDWTVCCNAPATPLAEMAADLWLLLLIRLAGNRKWIEEEIPKIRKKESYKMVECGGLMERWA
jgi:hypothetical protein